MNISQNIQNIINTQKRTQKELAKHLGIATSTINNWIKLNRSIPAEYVIPICEFLNISPYYLLTGKEKEQSMIFDDNMQRLIECYENLPDRERQRLIGRAEMLVDLCEERGETNNIPKIIMTTMNIADVAAGAGVSTPFTIDDAFSPKEVPSNVVPSGADCGVPINGDSMEPNYPNGSIAWVKITQEIEPSDVVIAILNGEPYCKIYQPDGLHSFNEDYEIMRINEEDNFSIFGKVIGCYEV